MFARGAFWVSAAVMCSLGLSAQVPRVTAAVSDQVRVVLPRNTPRFATAANDRGAAPAGMALRHMLLVLKRSDRQEMDLQLLLDRQRAQDGPDYHRWLTPQAFGQRFGPAPSDVAQVEGWLESEGFSIEQVAAGRGVIEFSGTAGTVAAAFHTTLHRYQLAGTGAGAGLHWANDTDPSIPAALAPVVAGVASLGDLRSRAASHAAGAVRLGPDLNFSDGSHAIAPGDFAAIYDTQPLLKAGINGQGQTIAITARADIDPLDFAAFTNDFTAVNTKLNQENIDSPGEVETDAGDLAEATLDAEWAAAVAPGATVDLIVSQGSDTTDGIDLAALYIVDNDLAPVMTTSYVQCESLLGAAENQFWRQLYEQAAAEGISAFVSAGDNGAAGCDLDTNALATHGAAVSGLASTPFDTAVGGTEFDEGGGQYWYPAPGGSTSAVGYIPETAWNESAGGSSVPASLFAGSGGVSALYSKPAWQSAPGVPQDGQRDLPDVALDAAIDHDGYVVCLTSQGKSCPNWVFLFGGTSVGTPAMAGIAALIDQKTGQRQGLMNPALYQLFHSQPAAFHDIASGNTSVPGQAGFTAGPGYDLATGLGSLDAAKLADSWSSAAFAATTTTLALSPPANLVHGQTVPLGITVAASSGAGPTLSGAVELLAEYSDGQTVAAGTFPLDASGQVGATATTGLPGGSYSLVALYSGDAHYASSASPAVAVSVQAEPSTTAIHVVDYRTGTGVETTTVNYGDPVSISAEVAGASGQGTPTGKVAFNGVYNAIPLNPQGRASQPFPARLGPAGTQSLSASYQGDSSFLPSAAAPFALTIQPGPTTVQLTSSTDASGGPTFTAVVSTQAWVGSPPAGLVEFYAGGQKLTAMYAEPRGTNPADGTLVAAATFTPNQLPGANATVTAQFQGDANYAASPMSNGVSVVTPPNVVFDPASVDFGDVAAGGSATRTLTATNAGGLATYANSKPATAAPFSETDTCGAGLAPGASCQVSLTFAPTLAGTYSAVLVFGASTVALSGAAPGVFLSNLQVSATNITAGQSVEGTFDVAPFHGYVGSFAPTCSGLPPLATCTFDPVQLDGTHTTQMHFKIQTTAPPASGAALLRLAQGGGWGAAAGGLLLLLIALAATGWIGGSGAVPRLAPPDGGRTWRWTPAALVLVTAASIACGGGGGGGGGGGTVTPPPPPSLGALYPSVSSLGFGNVGIGQTASQTFNLTSSGAGPVTLLALNVTQPSGDSNAFHVSSDCPGTLAPGNGCHVKVVYSPGIAGVEGGVLQIRDDGPGSPEVVTLMGTGLDHTPSGYANISVNSPLLTNFNLVIPLYVQ